MIQHSILIYSFIYFQLIQNIGSFSKKQQQDKVMQQQQTLKKEDQSLNASYLLALLDKNDSLFQQVKQHLHSQLKSYEAAFSRQHNKYIEDRDFDHFSYCCQNFSRKGKSFINRLSEIKNNCSNVIKALPQAQNVGSKEKINCFDQFINQQIDKTLQTKIKRIQYQKQTQTPFKNQFQAFLE